MIRPLGDRVVVKPAAKEEVTKSGIVLPDTAKEKPQKGEVVAVGSGRLLETGQRVPMDLKVGDEILFSKYAGNEIKIDDVEYLILREMDILGVIE
ncbi:chaperonin Cpn10 [Desulfofarcimen acetoxidans DSM 771]|jgi:chaperonin GroES|uniref:Co-chaperonin GroES n=1 Tax=Desulfofarcimen acetoxidans (strain ATCC 49208 / DSM 771 / KCTC 5769 / VKM B-1644 / 5575) TaxID=485916 RepID=C8W5V3_DESAS|nr:co-chaperone GroES [Desulfofarcimen acetoxidans]ACV64103.1 chaperonin Cpn10 [Desulfofarcimen acetoxidans DSM 771]